MHKHNYAIIGDARAMFPALPPLTLKLLSTMAAIITFERVKTF